MATWKKVITAADDANYKNNSISLAQLDAGLDGESNYGANKILKVNGAGNAIIWADDSGGIALTDLSVGTEGTASGDGAISYNNSSGVFTYTPPANLPNQSVSTTSSPTFQDDLYVKGVEGADAKIHLYSDEGDDTSDKWSMQVPSSGATFSIYQDTTEQLSVSSAGYLETTGNLKVGGDIIKASDGTTALTLTASSGNVTSGGQLSAGTNGIIGGSLQVNGGDLNVKTTSNADVFIIDNSNGGGSANEGTMTGNFTVTGNLTVNGSTTTISTTNLTVEDKQIVIANGSADLAAATGSGIVVDMGATAAHMPDLIWNSGRGGGNTDGTATNVGLTGWSISNSLTSNYADHPIAIMDFGTADMGSSDHGAGVGSFYVNTDDNEIFVRTA